MPNFPFLYRGATVTQLGPALQWTKGAAVCADGAPNVYGPTGTNHLDLIGNAHVDPRDLESAWCGVVTDKDGNPIIQGPSDPFPGFYVSPTAGHDPKYNVNDPRRYLDARTVPYIVVPEIYIKLLGGSMYDVCLVAYKNVTAPAFVGEIGPHFGEYSMATCQNLGINNNPKNGGCDSGVTCTIWPGSSKGYPRSVEDIAEQVNSLSTVS